MTKEQAQQLLHVPADVDRARLDKRLSVLLRGDAFDSDGRPISKERIMEAYSVLSGSDAPAEKPGKQAKFRNFMYYARWYIIGGVIVAALLVYLITAVVGARGHGLTVVLIGDFDTQAAVATADVLETSFEGIGNADVSVIAGAKNQYMSQIKAAAVLESGDADLIVLDGEALEFLSGYMAADVMLDELPDVLSFFPSDSASGSRVALELPEGALGFNDVTLYAATGRNAKHPDKIQSVLLSLAG